jgi:hypothetical protein
MIRPTSTAPASEHEFWRNRVGATFADCSASRPQSGQSGASQRHLGWRARQRLQHRQQVKLALYRFVLQLCRVERSIEIDQIEAGGPKPCLEVRATNRSTTEIEIRVGTSGERPIPPSPTRHRAPPAQGTRERDVLRSSSNLNLAHSCSSQPMTRICFQQTNSAHSTRVTRQPGSASLRVHRILRPAIIPQLDWLVLRCRVGLHLRCLGRAGVAAGATGRDHRDRARKPDGWPDQSLLDPCGLDGCVPQRVSHLPREDTTTVTEVGKIAGSIAHMPDPAIGTDGGLR